MSKITVEVLESLQKEVNKSEPKIKKLFDKQKRFMELNAWYPSLGRTKLQGVCDKYDDPLWEIRLNKKDRIVFVERDNGDRVIWLKIIDHDSLARKNTIHAKGNYKDTP
jgi:hypothetical protein